MPDNLISSITDRIREFVSPYVEKAGDFLSDAWDTVNDFVVKYNWDTSEKEAKVEGFIKDTINAAVDFASDLVRDTEDYVDGSSWDTINEAIKQYGYVTDTLEDLIRDSVEDAKDKGKAVEDTVKDGADKKADDANNLVDDVIDFGLNVLNLPPFVRPAIAAARGEFDFSPLAFILGGLADSIANRINGFIANALGIEVEE